MIRLSRMEGLPPLGLSSRLVMFPVSLCITGAISRSVSMVPKVCFPTIYAPSLYRVRLQLAAHHEWVLRSLGPVRPALQGTRAEGEESLSVITQPLVAN